MKLDVKHMDFDWESRGEALAGLSQAAVVSLMDDYYNTYLNFPLTKVGLYLENSIV